MRPVLVNVLEDSQHSILFLCVALQKMSEASSSEPTSPTTSPPSQSPPDFLKRNSFSPDVQASSKYTTRAYFAERFVTGVNEIMRFIYTHHKITSYTKISLVDGSNMFFLDKKASEWTHPENKIALLRAIPADHTVIIVMKHDTFLTIQAYLPTRRLLLDASRSNVCIVTVDIPFCSPLMKATCIRKVQMHGRSSQCSLSRTVRAPVDSPRSRAVHRQTRPRHRDRHDPMGSASRFLQVVTDFSHIHCEYDDVVLSKLHKMMYGQPTVVSMDRQVIKETSEVEIFNEFNPLIHIRIITATA